MRLLSVLEEGHEVAAFSASIPILGDAPRTEHLEADAAVALVEAMSRSHELLALARRTAAPTRGSGGAVIAD